MALEAAPDTKRIHADQAIMFGKPVIRGTRIPVTLVLNHLAFNLDLDDLFAAYPHLTREDIQAVLAFASESVDAEYRRSCPEADTDPFFE